MNKYLTILFLISVLSISQAEWTDSNGVRHLGSKPAQQVQETGGGFKRTIEQLNKEAEKSSQQETTVQHDGKKLFKNAVVIQVIKHGLIIQEVYINQYERATSTVDLLLKNYPNEKKVVDGDVLPPFSAREAGIEKLKRVSGAIATMRVYDCNDAQVSQPEQKDQKSPEVEKVNAPNSLIPSDLKILQAEYGDGSKKADVSEILMSKLNQGSLRIGNDTLGSDPAPGKTKSLSLKYSKDGVEKTISIKEGDSIIFSSL
jgi:hypothetical protein